MIVSKPQIILTAFDLFSQFGIKSVSMDDIARNMSISKRTLYGFFEDKESLVVEGKEYIDMQLTIHLNKLEQTDLTAVDIIILFYEDLLKRPRWYSKKFYDDMKRYPKVLEKYESEKKAFVEKCMQIFNRGVKEGVFQSEINFEIVALLAKDQIKMIHPSQSYCNHSNTEVYNTILTTFLRGICTEKGRLILDKWINTKQIQGIN